MLPLHADKCACITILLLFTLHVEPTDYIRSADDLLRMTPYLVSQLQLFAQITFNRIPISTLLSKIEEEAKLKWQKE